VTSPAETIRRAAELIRERSQAATQGPWRRAADAGEIAARYHPNFVAFWDGEYLAGVCDTGDGDDAVLNQAARDATYIASVHPLVGAALADWLDREAALVEAQVFPQSDPAMVRYPLAVACAFLGEEAPS